MNEIGQNTKFLIVGLGLMGGSYAEALSSKGFTVNAITKDQESVDYALKRGIINEGSVKIDPKLIKEADIIIFALYPHVLIEWITEHQNLIKPNTLLTDVTGVKRAVVPKIQSILRDDLEFIGSHPMAGRETSGIAHSAEVNFAPANFIITPTEKNSQAGIDWCRDLAAELGFKRISVLTPAEHDHMIGYVSQLCHAIAVSLMLANDDPRLPLFTGDSFRDLTRIARIDETLWSELFLHNRDALLQQIDRSSAALAQLREQVATENEAGLKAMFRISSQRRSWLNQPQQPGAR